MKRVLELPAFRRLLVAYTLNELASFIGVVALAFLVYRRTGSAIGAAAFFLCAEFAPALASPLLVARLDQRSVRRVLGLLYALQGLVFLMLAWLVGRFALASVLVLALVGGVLATSAWVMARAAWTTLSRGRGLLREANAIINGSFSVCYLVGPAVGGAVVALDGTVAALLVNAGAYVVITVVVATAGALPEALPDRTPAAGRVRAALGVARNDQSIRGLLGLQALAMAIFAISIPVEVVFAQHSLHAGATGYGLLLSAWGGGAIVGSAIYARWRVLPSRTLMTLGACLFGIGFAAMALAPSLAPAVVGCAVAGTGNGIQIVAMRTALQEATPEKWMALILSLNESMFLAVPGIGILAGGAIAALAGPRVALGAGAAGSVVIALATWARLKAVSTGARTVAPPPVERSATDEPLTAGARRS